MKPSIREGAEAEPFGFAAAPARPQSKRASDERLPNKTHTCKLKSVI